MSKIRKIKKILKSKPTIEGAGVHLKRGFVSYQSIVSNKGMGEHGGGR